MCVENLKQCITGYFIGCLELSAIQNNIGCTVLAANEDVEPYIIVMETFACLLFCTAARYDLSFHHGLKKNSLCNPSQAQVPVFQVL